MRALSKSTRNKVTIFLAAMFGLNCAVMWDTRQSIVQGLPDFTIFYTAARILRQGDGAHLYDNNLQQRVQQSFASRSLASRGSLLPYNHPPFEALLFAPLAHFSYLAAYSIWLVINLFLLTILAFVLRLQLTNLAQLPFFIWILASLAFFPIFAALIKGQDSILLLFLYSLAFAGLRRSREGAAGVWTGLALFKYNFVLPFALSRFWRKRFAAAFLAIALALIFTSALVTGWSALRTYPLYVLSAERNPQFVWNRSAGNTPNLHGVISTVLPVNDGIRLGLTFAASLLILFLMWRANRRSSAGDPLAFAIAVTGAELVSYHTFVHDLSVLFLPLLIALNQLNADGQPPRRARTVLSVCSLILFCSPVYMVLMLHYNQLEIMAFVIMIFFFTLLELRKQVSDPEPAT